MLSPPPLRCADGSHWSAVEKERLRPPGPRTAVGRILGYFWAILGVFLGPLVKDGDGYAICR